MDKNIKNLIKKNKNGNIRINTFELEELFLPFFDICENNTEITFLEKELKKLISEVTEEKKLIISEK